MNFSSVTSMVFFTISANICFAQSADFARVAELNPGTSHVTVWSRTWSGERAPVLESLGKTLDSLAVHWIFKERLPKRAAILIDGEWTKSSGYWASTLSDPEGVPAVLISAAAATDPNEVSRLFTHELTHLIYFSVRPDEPSWIREGVAMLAEYLVTGYFDPALREGFATPETSLLATADPSQPDYISIRKQSAQYGHVLQYFYYIYRLCGQKKLFDRLFGQLLTSSDDTGIEFIDQVLRASESTSPACKSFEQSFRAFELARFLGSASSPETYVFITADKATVRDGADQLPTHCHRIQPARIAEVRINRGA